MASSSTQTIASTEHGTHSTEALRYLATTVHWPQKGGVTIATQRLNKPLARNQTLSNRASKRLNEQTVTVMSTQCLSGYTRRQKYIAHEEKWPGHDRYLPLKNFCFIQRATYQGSGKVQVKFKRENHPLVSRVTRLHGHYIVFV